MKKDLEKMELNLDFDLGRELGEKETVKVEGGGLVRPRRVSSRCIGHKY